MDPKHSSADPIHPRTVPTAGVRSRVRVRRWMTGSLAIVMASLSGHAASSSLDRRGGARISPYGLAETVRRIEQVAVEHGLPVLARVDRSTRAGGQWVIVLASSEGGTPVVLDEPDAPPDVPLSIHVVEGPDGAAWVRWPSVDSPAADRSDSDWPDSVVDELAGLPMLVELALH